MSEVDVVKIGDVVDLQIDKVANGGFCIARYNGQVVFVRHGIPGETVKAEITDISKKFLRADVVEVVSGSEHRVTASLAHSKPLCPNR
jgi:tRNA/tmRNA/rRNA uracil-C5-methylase (TrmA/RlmC/RlmD family)